MAAVFALAAQRVNGLLSIDRRNTAALDLVITAIQHLAHLDTLGEVPRHGVLDELIRRAAGGRGEFLEARFSFGSEVYHQGSQFRGPAKNCQNDCDRVG